MPAIDAQRRRRQPRQRYPSRRGVDVDGAAQDLAGVGKIELGLGPHRHVEAFEAGELGQGACKSARHQALHGHGELQLVGGLDLVGSEVEGPGAGKRLDLGPAGDRAAASAMIQVDAELQHPPDALAAAVVDDDGCRLEPDLAQVGAGTLASAGARGRLRQDLDEIDAAEPALGIDLACRWRNRRLCRPAPDRDLGALAARGLRGRCELERKRAVLAVEQRQARRDQVDAFGRDAAAQQRLAAERDQGRRRHRQGHVVGVGDADVLELELDLAAVAQTQGHVLDGDADRRDLLGNRALDGLGKEAHGDRTVQQAHVEEPGSDQDREDDQRGQFGRDAQRRQPRTRGRGCTTASRCGRPLAGRHHRPRRPLPSGRAPRRGRHTVPSPA